MGPDPIGTIWGQIITFSDCATFGVGVLLALLMAIDSIKICKE